MEQSKKGESEKMNTKREPIFIEFKDAKFRFRGGYLVMVKPRKATLIVQERDGSRHELSLEKLLDVWVHKKGDHHYKKVKG